MTEPFDANAHRWADAHHIADAVRQHVKNHAYINNGGTDGCGKCINSGLGFEQRVAAGHATCAREMIEWETVQRLASSIGEFELDIAISRSLDDPRLFQWRLV